MEGADFLYTDVWVSMGEPASRRGSERIKQLLPYQVNAERRWRRPATPTSSSCTACPRCTTPTPSSGADWPTTWHLDALEVTDEVFESPASIVFDQAENRLHTIKAVMVATLGD